MINSKFFGLLLLLFSIVLVASLDGIGIDSSVDVTFLLILTLSSIGIVSREKQPYSLYRMFFLFVFFFFGIAPFLQYRDGGFSGFGSTPLEYGQNLQANLLIISILCLYPWLYNIFYDLKRNNSRFMYQRFLNGTYITSFSIGQNLRMVAIASFSLFVMLYMNNFNIVSLLFRGGEFVDRVEFSSGTVRLIITKVFQPMMMVCLLFYLGVKNRKFSILFFLFLITIIGSSPTGMPRFAAAALYIPLALFTFPFLHKKNNFSLLISFGLLCLFPFLNSFRHFGTNRDIGFGLDFDIFLENSFDSYQHFATVIGTDIITYGRQLLGVVLFWVPRSIWQNKPIGSGAFLADELGYFFNNISFNYFAEGYINFGFTGIFLFLVVFAYFTAYLDVIFWETNHRSDFFKIVYFLLLGLSFLILRGDLLSSTAFTFGFVFSVFLVRTIVMNNDRTK
jgi:hypothetical protein